MAVNEMRAQRVWPHDVLTYTWRVLTVGVGCSVAITFGSAIVSMTGLPYPATPGGTESAASLLVSVLSGVLLGVVLGRISERLALPFYQRAGVLFVLLFMLNDLINALEGIFFTTVPVIERLSGLLVVGIGHAVFAMLVAWFFAPSENTHSLLNVLRTTFKQRHYLGWIWRIGLAGVLYVPSYLLFGLLIAPIVTPYYQNPALGLSLTMPSIGTILLLETGRGLLFVLTLCVGVAVLRTPRRLTVLLLWPVISTLGAWVPMLQATWLPLMLRVVHGLEISGDALLQSITLVWLFGYRAE